MGRDTRFNALVPEGQSLVDPEAVLFIDDDQAKPGKDDFLLEEGVGARYEGGTSLRDLGEGRPPPGLSLFAADPDDGHTEGFKPALEGPAMLIGEEFRGAHEGDLETALDGLQGGYRRNHGLAGAHVPL